MHEQCAESSLPVDDHHFDIHAVSVSSEVLIETL
jgi:hypothetical protein